MNPRDRTVVASRAIGPLGTAARIVVGLTFVIVPFAVGSPPGGRDLLIGLVGLPAVFVAAHWLAARGIPGRLALPGACAHTLNLAVAVTLFAAPFTREAAFLFYGTSMLLAAARADAGCEVLSVSNWLLRRRDRLACPVFSPIDHAERPASRGATG